jgi:PIN domain nuclease of toxin-antitoxin system
VRLLLDTHVLLWWLQDEPRLGPSTRALIANPANDVLVSVVSLWEMVVKQRVGKLEADVAAIVAMLPDQGLALLPIAPAHLAILAQLPAHHQDPFDHLLIAQAIGEDATFVSADRRAPLYPLSVEDCAR